MQDNILSNIFYKAFEKVIKINLKEGTFEEIENGKQHPVEYSGIDQWFIKFANDSTLCPYDKKRFCVLLMQKILKHFQQTKIQQTQELYISEKLMTFIIGR